MNPKVSVIIPNYNHAPFLQQRFDTVFNQTFQDFEVILLDDASTDGSLELLQRYAQHPKVSQLVLNTKNSGSPFKQWKKGIDLAQGAYIWIAESDDYCELNFLETLLKLFEKNTVLVYCASEIINFLGEQEGRHVWADALDKKRWTKSYTNTGENEILEYLRFRNTITNASAVVFKKKAVDDIAFPVHMTFCGDWYIWIELLKQGEIAYTCQRLNYFRRHRDTTKSVKPLPLEQKRVHEYIEIVMKHSNGFSRFINRSKYYWIFDEWRDKFKSNHKIKNLPLDFLIYNTFRKF
ncbi:glycosyltransferase family 2 protein [Tamlana fucoidanivorans]|uniref:Glycosyltransferase family 2 protein n=1 Tax=Allotamlana fucoidanivorans TaxID=2583814 RepID=A0A5C4SPN7_9FLAO|nr:glycosyltransferase family 2 protein [Tamlana fucoidanivorans]TNJ45773.1 glycosyltransferase family 2 protein [Tamlana fucoidanivorans]